MKIKSLSLKNFKRFQDKQLKFTDGTNIVHGKNEQGKSTISSALLQVLYGDPTSHSKKFQEEFSSWQSSGNIQVSAELEIKGKVFELTKDFTDHKFFFKDAKTGKEYDNYKVIFPRLMSKIGIPTVELFKSTAWFSNTDLAEVHQVKSLSEAIKHAIVGMGGVKLQEALKEIRSELTELNKGLSAPSKSPGVIKHLREEISERKAKLNEIQGEVDKLKGAMEQKRSSGSQIAELEEEIKKLEEELKLYDEVKAAKKEIEGIDEKGKSLERDIQEVKRIQAELTAKTEEVKNYAHLDRIDLNKLEDRLAAVRMERGKLESDIEEIEDVEISSPKFGLPEIAIIVGGVIIGLLLGVLVRPSVGIIIGVGAIAGSVAYYGMRWSGYSVRLKNAQKSVQKKQKQKFTKIEELKAMELAMLQKAGANSFEEFAAARAKYESLKLNTKELSEALSGYLQGRKLQDMEQQQLELFTRKKEIETTKLTDAAKAAEMSESEYYKKRSDLDMLRLDLRDLTAAQGASEARVEDSEVSTDDAAKLEEEIASMQEELTYYERKARVLARTAKGIKEARDQMVGNSKEFIETGIINCLRQVTGGRYEKARLSADLDVEVFSPDKNDWVVPDESLSRGTIDQVYFSFRLALLEVISEGRPVPLVLDDPFLTFDEERLESTKNMLNSWAKNHQIFLFTTRSEYKDWGNVVEI